MKISLPSLYVGQPVVIQSMHAVVMARLGKGFYRLMLVGGQYNGRIIEIPRNSLMSVRQWNCNRFSWVRADRNSEALPA